MTPSEEYFLKVRNKLDDLGFLQPLSFESVMLVDKLLEDLLETKKNLQHYKNVAQQSMEAFSELQVGVGPYKEDNAKLLKENNELRQKLLKAREAIGDTKVEPVRRKDTSKVDKNQMFDKSQEKINNLTREITKLKSEQQELDEVIECLKNKVTARDAEIERLNGLLADGRPLMSQNQCPCCSPQLLDCRLLAKNKELSDQLEESKQKQHEAMVRALELAERNQLLESRNISSARSNASQGSKRCCCAENSNKICKLQEKLEERILQVEKLEQELSELRKAHSELRSDKLSVDKILELTMEDKKKMNDRINELTIIEHDLMLEIERLKRTNASQKSQLAELESQIKEFEQMSQTTTASQAKPQGRPVTGKSAYGNVRTQESRRPTQPVQKKVTISKPTPVPPKPIKAPVAPKKPSGRVPETATDTSTMSSGLRRGPAPPSSSTSPSPPLDLRELLARERRQFQQQLEEMERQQAEHCAKFHPPPCPRSATGEPASKEADSQWLLLERVQAERDYYHKEFTRLRDQLCNIPDHSAEASTGPSSPHEKLERLLSERDYYHKEMCRLLEALSKCQSSQKAVSDLRPLCCRKNNCFCMP